MSTVKYMRISDKDISEIPSYNMAKLASIVKERVYINNSTPMSQLGTILASVHSKVLWLCDLSLSEENTRALVTAMRARVKTVRLWENVTLDPELLAAYDGQGHCTKLVMYRDTRRRYRTRLSRWAADRGWTVTCEDSEELEMERISQTSSPGSENQGSCTVI